MGIMYAFAVLANALHSPLPIIIWMTLALALGILWERVSGDRKTEGQKSKEPQTAPLARAFAIACGIAGAAVIAATDIGLWRKQGVLFSLIGAQFYVPFGAFVLGAIVSTIYVWVLSLVKHQVRRSDLYIMASMSVLSMALSYLIFFHSETVGLGYSPSLVEALSKSNLLNKKGQLFGVTPILILTPLIQLIGYVIGSWIVYWREERRVQHPRE